MASKQRKIARSQALRVQRKNTQKAMRELNRGVKLTPRDTKGPSLVKRVLQRMGKG